MYQDRYEDHSISLYVYFILLFLALLFYGNVFWVFKKAARYKNSLARVAICLAWFALVFGANYYIVGPLFENANQAGQPPPIPHTKKEIAFAIAHIRPDHPNGPPHVEVVNFMISNWQPMQPVMLFAFLTIFGISIAYFSLKEWAKSERIQAQLQADQLSTEIKFLKSQVNPHFLFNTLNNLFSIAQSKGNDELADGISKLSGMMRYMIYESNEELVPLKKEIEYLQNCITLNKLRYADDEAKVIFDHPEKTDGIFVAPMLFIPFVENAFKHGVAIGTPSEIDISVLLTNGHLIFNCANNNYSYIKKMEMEISGIGLENVKRRLALLYPQRHQLMIDNSDDRFIVKLNIDLS